VDRLNFGKAQDWHRGNILWAIGLGLSIRKPALSCRPNKAQFHFQVYQAENISRACLNIQALSYQVMGEKTSG